MRAIAALAAAAVALQGCVRYHVYVKDPTPVATSLRVADQGIRVTGHVLSLDGPDDAGRLTAKALTAVAGAQERVASYRRFDEYRYWSPMFIPAGFLLAVYGGVGGLFDLASDPGDRLYWTNTRYPFCPSISVGGLDSMIGVWPWAGGFPSCGPGGPPSAAVTQVNATGASVDGSRPDPDAAVEVSVTARDASGAVIRRIRQRGLRTGPDGALALDLSGYFSRFPRAPATVEVAARLEDDARAAARVQLGAQAAAALFAPVEEARRDAALQRRMARARQAAEKDGDRAMAGGDARGAFAKYLQAWRVHGSDREVNQRLEAKIIEASLDLDPPPEIPETAQRHLDGARSFAAAPDGSGLGDAVTEAEEAVDFAPWWSKAYYLLGFAQQKTGDYAGAAANFKLFLLAAPDSAEAPQVKDTLATLQGEQASRR